MSSLEIGKKREKEVMECKSSCRCGGVVRRRSHISSNTDQQENRVAGMDFVRILSMLGVLIIHYLGHGQVLETVHYGSVNYYFAWLMKAVTVGAVDCFILISGYFLVRKQFQLSKVFNLWMEVEFYSVACCLVSQWITGGQRDVHDLLSAAFPVITKQYWFYTRYCLLYLLTPMLNHILNRVSEKQYRICLISGLICFSVLPNLLYGTHVTKKVYGGTHILWFCYLYAVGAYFNIYLGHKCVDYKGADAHRKGRTPILMYAIWTLLVFGSKVILDSFAQRQINWIPQDVLFSGNNAVLVILAAVSLFCYMIPLKIKSKRLCEMICKLSPLTFGVYLIHDNHYLRGWLWKELIKPFCFSESIGFIAYFMVTTIMLFGICLLIEKLRQTIFMVVKKRLGGRRGK